MKSRTQSKQPQPKSVYTYTSQRGRRVTGTGGCVALCRATTVSVQAAACGLAADMPPQRAVWRTLDMMSQAMQTQKAQKPTKAK